MSYSANWNYPTSVRFGAGRVSELPKICATVGMKRPLLVTDPFLATQTMTLKALEAGKVIAFMAGQTRPMWDFEDVGDWWTRADPAGIAPVIAVPTTAGTGSEVGRAGVITQEATHTEKVIFHPKMMPRMVICDPELTAGMPPSITMGT